VPAVDERDRELLSSGIATYILLLTLTPEGQTFAQSDPGYLRDVADGIKMAGVQMLGLYAVLGQYDFVTMVEAPNNETMARFSIELGVKAGVHVTTLPVIPAARLEPAAGGAAGEAEQDLRLIPPRRSGNSNP
jgi:uncharacterized protein with GYD domain